MQTVANPNIKVLRRLHVDPLNPSQKTIVSPVQEKSTGKYYTGQGPGGYGEMDKEEIKDLLVHVTPDTQITLMDGRQFNLDSPIDKIHWEWLMRHPYIENTKEEALKKPSALFYVEDIKLESSRRVKNEKLISKAIGKLDDFTREQLNSYAIVLGLPQAPSLVTEELESWVIQQIKEDPSKVLDLFEGVTEAQVNALRFANELIHYKIIVKSGKTSTYMYNDLSLGVTRDDVADFLYSDEEVNKQTCLILRKELESRLN